MRSLLSRRISHLVVSLALILGLSGASHALTTESAAFSGIVKDTVGNLVEGVEVLVVDKSTSLIPVVTVKSDAEGRFRVSRLPRGAYRIAALKDGYLTYVGRIDTRLQQWLNVVLHPMPTLEDDRTDAIPVDASWVYRLPRRYVLDSRKPDVLADPPASDEPVGETTVRETLRLQVDQLFSTAGPMGAGHEGRHETQGSETHLRVASAVGDRGSIDVRGSRESFDSALEHDDALEAASRDAAAVTLAFSYDTSPGTQLDVTAFYSHRALEYSTNAAGFERPQALPASVEQGHRQWGYDANWSTRLDDVSKLSVKVDYQNTRFRVPGAAAALELPSQRASQEGSMYTQSVGASGVYESVPAEDHAVQIDFRAQVLDTTDPVRQVDPAALTPAYLALSGLSVGINAQDRWTVSGPWSLVYGLGYRHAITSHDASLIVPRVGGAWGIDRLAVRVLVSYHSVADWSGGPAVEGAIPYRPADAMGYEAEIDLPLPAGLRLSGATSYSPIQFDYVGYAGAGFDDDPRPLYLTDGNAAVRESRIALVQESRRTRTYLEVTEGLVEGTLAAMTPYDVPQEFLTTGALTYGTGRLGLRVFSSGTEVLIQYQQLSQSPTELAPMVRSRQSSVEFRLTQDLLDMQSIGSWRFLMAIRRASLDADETEESPMLTSGVIDSMNHQISAGLSLSF